MVCGWRHPRSGLGWQLQTHSTLAVLVPQGIYGGGASDQPCVDDRLPDSTDLGSSLVVLYHGASFFVKADPTSVSRSAWLANGAYKGDDRFLNSLQKKAGGRYARDGQRNHNGEAYHSGIAYI